MADSDWFTEAFGSAITDIRQKLVEEPWFGHPLSTTQTCRTLSLAEGLGWATAQPASEVGARMHSEQGHTIEHER